MAQLTRREFLRLVASVPALAAAGALLSPLLRLLKPTFKPFRIFEAPHAAQGEPIVAATLSALGPWDSQKFEFVQRTTVYSRHQYQESRVPGVVVKLPDGKVSVVSRICPHLGCTFNYEQDPAKVKEGYDFLPDQPVFACPCHFSVFEVKSGTPISGPLVGTGQKLARFDYKVENDQVVVTNLEQSLG